MNLSDIVPAEEWRVYREFIDACERKGLRSTIGGGLAFSAYSERMRETKDVDFNILHEDLERFQAVLAELGFVDYYDVEPYDRSWIYRSHKDCTIIDLIWSLPNHRLQVEPTWFSRGGEACVHGKTVRLMPIEELIQTKMYVLQRDRCDWPDVLNIIHRAADKVDWDHLLDVVDQDTRLLGALLNVYAWICQSQIDNIPSIVWERTGVHEPRRGPCNELRAPVLDTRDWFGPGYTDRSQFKH